MKDVGSSNNSRFGSRGILDPVTRECLIDGISRMQIPGQLQEVLANLLDGFSEKQIAARLKLPQGTVHRRIKLLHTFFNVHSRGELISRSMSLLLKVGRGTGNHSSQRAEFVLRKPTAELIAEAREVREISRNIQAELKNLKQKLGWTDPLASATDDAQSACTFHF